MERPTFAAGEARLPWDDPAFSKRMLAEHLDEGHDLASRRSATIDAHVKWLLSLGPRGERRVLDLGCGPGLYLERFATAGWSCVGVDIAPAAIEYARDRAAQSGAACEYFLGDFRGAEMTGPFDLVLCLFGELSTVPFEDVRAVMARVAQRLAPDGRALIELSTEAGVRGKGQRASSWFTATGGLFATGDHFVLTESAWLEVEAASVERWWVIESSASAPQMLGSTTWWHGPQLAEVLASTGLTIEARYGDLCGKPPADNDDFETIVLRRVAV
jgi:2-polyprenyl-3-methyl-5-hydroxy-6-metoxy-1,4-benzoquinol methylase